VRDLFRRLELPSSQVSAKGRNITHEALQGDGGSGGPARLELDIEDLCSNRLSQLLERDEGFLSYLLEEAESRMSRLAGAIATRRDVRRLEMEPGTNYSGGLEPVRITVSEAESLVRRAQDGCSALGRLAAQIPKIQQDKAMETWHKMVAQFSCLQLRTAADRLPALSGLAHLFQPLLGGYVAGLWTRRLAFDMAWRVESISPGLQRCNEYTGPSWSWVSINAGVSHWKLPEMSPVSIFRRLNEETLERSSRTSGSFVPTSCSIRSPGKDLFGQISSAHLVIQGFTRNVKIIASNTPGPQSPSLPRSYELQISFSRSADVVVSSLSLPFYPDYDLFWDGPLKVDADNDEVLILLLFEDIWVVLVKERYLMRGGVVYRRVRIFRLLETYTTMYQLNLRDQAEKAAVTLI
jgi:hypothetical protein